MNTHIAQYNDENSVINRLKLPVYNKATISSTLSARGPSTTFMGTKPSQSTVRAPLSNISNQPARQAPIAPKNYVAKVPISSTTQTIQAPTSVPSTFKQPQPAVRQITPAVIHVPHFVTRNPPESPKIDSQYSNDPQHVTEFTHDIMEHYQRIELKYMPSSNYMEKQAEINTTHRAIVVDWLSQLHYQWKMLPDTIYLCVNIMDRFLSIKAVSRDRFQQLAVTCLLIACKYEEICCPAIKALVNAAGDQFTVEEVIRMERIVLSNLDFNVTVATLYPFLKRYLKCGRCEENMDVVWTTQYICEMSLSEYQSLQYTPSMMACSAIYLANRLNNVENPWNRNLEYYTGRQVSDIMPCVKFLWDSLKNQNRNSKLMTVKKKFASVRRNEVTKLVLKAIASANLVL
ncbi:cyclin [Acrasis kona]|uniref:Cyclin n=1 Tax=Acrasis kona TaxID=1008807 RepID=A0AAW2ZDF6_9EUKA